MYYLVAVIFAAFIVAIVCCKGWDYLFEIWARFYKEGLINVGKRFCYQNRAVCHEDAEASGILASVTMAQAIFRKRLRLY